MKALIFSITLLVTSFASTQAELYCDSLVPVSSTFNISASQDTLVYEYNNVASNAQQAMSLYVSQYVTLSETSVIDTITISLNNPLLSTYVYPYQGVLLDISYASAVPSGYSVNAEYHIYDSSMGQTCSYPFTISFPFASIAENNPSEISVFPNPFLDAINVGGLLNECSYKLFSSDGKMVQYGTISSQNSRINLNTLESGIFFLKIIDTANGGILQTEKILKE